MFPEFRKHGSHPYGLRSMPSIKMLKRLWTYRRKRTEASFRGFGNSRNLEVAHHEHVSFQALTSFFPATIIIHEPRALVYSRFTLACQTPVASNDALPYRAGHENHQRLLWSVSQAYRRATRPYHGACRTGGYGRCDRAAIAVTD